MTEDRRDFLQPRVSPDGRRLALSIRDPENQAWNIWVYELERDTFTRLTFEGTINDRPIWTPDGKWLTFRSNRYGSTDLYRQPSDGSGPVERLTQSENPQVPDSWSPDGSILAFTELGTTNGMDIWTLSLGGDRQPRPFLQMPFNERHGMFSPDGGWIAYTSDESGRDEVYVQAFPKSQQGPRIISTHGGREPMWSPDGRELYYRRRNQLVAVAVRTSPTFMPGQERILFEGNFVEEIGGRNQYYSVSPDGQSFLMVREGEGTTPQSLRIVFNWFEDLRRLVSTRN